MLESRVPGVLMLLLAGLVGVGCGSGEHDHAGHSGGGSVATSDAPREDGVPVMASLPAFEGVDQQGEPFTRDDLDGRIHVVDFIFTTCTDACPMLTREMAKLQGALAEEEVLGEVRLLSLSVDPETDTPETLRAYARRYGADLAHWSFVTGPRAALMELIQDGFKLAVMENADAAGTPFLHSQKFVIVDRQGRIRGYYDALEREGRLRLLEDLRKLTSPRDVAVGRPS